MARVSKVKSLSIDVDGIVHIILVSTSREEISTTCEHLRQLENPDIGWCLSSVPEYRSAAGLLSDSDIEKLAPPMHQGRPFKSLEKFFDLNFWANVLTIT